MANTQHLKILKKGTRFWNNWRKKNPKIKPDLSNADLRKINRDSEMVSNFIKIDFSETNLCNVKLYRANFFGAILSGANLSKINSYRKIGSEFQRNTLDDWNLSDDKDPLYIFTDAELNRVNLTEALFPEAIFYNANLFKAILKDSILPRSILIKANLKGTDARGANFYKAFFSEADLSESDFRRTNIVDAQFGEGEFRNEFYKAANLNKANLSYSTLEGAKFNKVSFINTHFKGVDFSKRNFRGFNFKEAELYRVNFSKSNLSLANFEGANLSKANLSEAQLVETNMKNTNLTDCRIYGIAAWNIKSFKYSSQSNLIISKKGDSLITVDNLEIAQFIYLLLHNAKIRNVIDSITSKVVLILGRFTPKRKVLLDAVRKKLCEYNYIPVLFDFEKPKNRGFIETVSTLAHMSKFVIADVTDPKIVLEEIPHIVRNIAVPVVPLLLKGSGKEPVTLIDLRKNQKSLLKTYFYTDESELLQSFKNKIIIPAEEKVKKLQKG